MAKVRLTGDASGFIELSAPTTAANNTLVFPNGNGTNGQYLQTNGSGALSWSGSLTQATAVASTSGTAIDFTGIPSWVKRITVMFNGVSTNGTSNILIQIGSGSFTTTGYNSTGSSISVAAGTSNATGGFLIYVANAVNTNSGHMLLTHLGSNIWISSNVLKNTTTVTCYGAGDVTLSGTLDRIRITTVNGTDTFDAGSINIMYEG